jgi:hypothetical protein
MTCLKKLLTVLVISSFLYSCAAPGSAIGRIGIKGEILSKDVKNLKITFELPENYGIGGLDKPSDHKHEKPPIEMVVDKEGKFSGYYGAIYHVTVFLLPPLGAKPEIAPKPKFIYARFSDSKDELYIFFPRMEESQDGFEYYVYDKSIKTKEAWKDGKVVKISKDKASWIIESGNFVKEKSQKNENEWVLYLKIRKNKI